MSALFNSVVAVFAALGSLLAAVASWQGAHGANVMTGNKMVMLTGTVALGVVSAAWAVCSCLWRRHERVVNLNLALISCLIFAPLLGEVVIRAGIRANLSVFQNPELYADGYSSDDYWTLYALWSPPFIAQVDPLLGWSPVTSIENPLGVLRPVKALRATNSLLFFGDSFIAPQGETLCIPEFVQAQTAQPVYNFGVSGYGLDQILLRMQAETPRFVRPRVIVGILTLDIDRTVLNLRGAVKPRFELSDGELVLQNTPVVSLAEWLPAHPVTIHSYMFAALRRAAELLRAGLDDQRVTARQAEKIALTRALLWKLSRANVTVMVFYPPGELMMTGWRETCLLQALNEFGIPFVDTKPLLLSSGLPLSALYDRTEHHTAHANRLLAIHLMRVVRTAQRISNLRPAP